MAGWGGKRKGAGRPKGSKRSQADQDKLTATGEFMEGNALRHQGRPNVFLPDEMREKVAEFLELRQETEKPPTWPGLAVHLGLSRQALHAYRKGERGKTDQERSAYRAIFEVFDSHIEDQLEGLLQRERGQTGGIQHRLNNRYSDDWRTSQHDWTAGQTLEVHIDLGRAVEYQKPMDTEVIEHGASHEDTADD